MTTAANDPCFPEWLEARRQWVDDALDRHLPASDTRPAVLHEAMRYSVMAGGKRLRPILALAACEACGGDAEAATLPALALELFHTYTLIHDDLPCMDDDALRRGRPTCHIRFGEATALLAGDALLTLAFEWMALGPAPRECVLELARAGGAIGVVGGQVEDLAAESATPDRTALEWIHLHKTAKLLEASVVVGARCAGAPEPQVDALRRYATGTGLAFQIIDDILDETSTTEQLGKPVGSDRAADKMTYVKLMGVATARAEAEGHLRDALEALRTLPGGAPRLAGLARFIVERTT